MAAFTLEKWPLHETPVHILKELFEKHGTYVEGSMHGQYKIRTNALVQNMLNQRTIYSLRKKNDKH